MNTKSTLEKAVKFVHNCKFIFSFKKNIFKKNIFSVLFSLITTISFSQTRNIDSYLANLEANGQESSSLHLKHLLSDLQSAVYYYAQEGSAKTYGNNPTTLYTDINSFSSIGSASIQNSNIEIAIIKISNTADFNKTIDLALLSGFQKLKYIYILSEVQTTETALNNLIKNDGSQYVIIYKISIGG